MRLKNRRKMSNYLKTIYFTGEYKKNKYPQKLCDYVCYNYFGEYIKENNLKNQKYGNNE